MPAVFLRFELDLGNVPAELMRLTRPPTQELEAALLSTFAITQGRVHVITGKLKASGHPTTEYVGDVWTGTLNYDRYPGIYELARGNRPTANHPEGGHFFFDPVEGYPNWEDGEGPRAYERVIMDWLEG